MEERTEIIPTQLANGSILHVQATMRGGEEDVAFTLPPFHHITNVIEGIASSVSNTFLRVHAQKGSVTFGLSITMEAGQIAAFLVKGVGNANLSVTLEWTEATGVIQQENSQGTSTT